MSRYIVEVIDPGCGCCSYLPVAFFDRIEDIPGKYLTRAYEIWDQGDDDE